MRRKKAAGSARKHAAVAKRGKKRVSQVTVGFVFLLIG